MSGVKELLSIPEVWWLIFCLLGPAFCIIGVTSWIERSESHE